MVAPVQLFPVMLNTTKLYGRQFYSGIMGRKRHVTAHGEQVKSMDEKGPKVPTKKTQTTTIRRSNKLPPRVRKQTKSNGILQTGLPWPIGKDTFYQVVQTRETEACAHVSYSHHCPNTKIRSLYAQKRK